MFREVTMIEVREVLRLWRAGLPKKRVAAQLGLDPKTVRRYLADGYRDRVAALTGVSLRVCPACRHGAMIIIERLLRAARSRFGVPDTS